MFRLIFCRKKGEKLDLTSFHTARRPFCATRTRSAQPQKLGADSPRQNTAGATRTRSGAARRAQIWKIQLDLNCADFKGAEKEVS